jgi:hypothetical protein
MPINPNQGLSQNITIRQGRVTSKDKTAEVGTVVKVNKGQEYQAWNNAATVNGADDFQFRTDSGDVYIASGVGFEKLGLQIGNMVDINGVKGRITALDNENNSQHELLMQKLGGAVIGGGGFGLVGALVGLMGTGSTIGIAVLGGIGLLAGLGMAIFGGKPVINLDRIKLFGSEVQ